MPDDPRLTWESWPPRESALRTGFDLWRRGLLGDAEVFFRDCLSDPTEDVLRGLGSVLWSQRRFAEARDCFASAIRAAPHNAMHWANLGLVLRDLALPDQAVAAFDVAIGLCPGYEPAWNERGNVLYDIGHHSEALRHYRMALSLDDTRAVVHHNLGMCLLALAQTGAAKAAFEQALAHDPGYQWSLGMLRRIG